MGVVASIRNNCPSLAKKKKLPRWNVDQEAPLKEGREGRLDGMVPLCLGTRGTIQIWQRQKRLGSFDLKYS